MNVIQKKLKPTLASLLADQSIATGKDIIKREIERERQKTLLEEAIEFERRNRRSAKR